MEISDQRDGDKRFSPRNGPWLCATDRVMSGWGSARHGKSYVAYDLEGLTGRQIANLEFWMEKRSDFKYVRKNLNLPRGSSNDTLSLYTPPEHIIRSI